MRAALRQKRFLKERLPETILLVGDKTNGSGH